VQSEDEVRRCPVRVADSGEGIPTTGGKKFSCRGKPRAREEDEIVGGFRGGADCGDSARQGRRPSGKREIVRLVHELEGEAGEGGGGEGFTQKGGKELRPQGGEVLVGRPRWTGLAYDGPVPAGEVVEGEEAVCAGGEASGDQLIIMGESGEV